MLFLELLLKSNSHSALYNHIKKSVEGGDGRLDGWDSIVILFQD